MRPETRSPPPGGAGERAGNYFSNSRPAEVIPDRPQTQAPEANNLVLIAALWQRTSAKGTPYLSGFLGKARLVAFRRDPLPEGTPTWKLFVSPGKGDGR